MKPITCGINVETAQSWEREMTEEEYEALLATGWVAEGEPKE